MAPSSEASRRAVAKYQMKLDSIRVRVPKGEKEKIAAFAKAQGESVNHLMVRLIYREMGLPEPGLGED